MQSIDRPRGGASWSRDPASQPGSLPHACSVPGPGRARWAWCPAGVVAGSPSYSSSSTSALVCRRSACISATLSVRRGLQHSRHPRRAVVACRQRGAWLLPSVRSSRQGKSITPAKPRRLTASAEDRLSYTQWSRSIDSCCECSKHGTDRLVSLLTKTLKMYNFSQATAGTKLSV